MEDSSQWKVPIAVCTSVSPTESAVETLLEKDTCTVLVSGVEKGQWMKVYENHALAKLTPNSPLYKREAIWGVACGTVTGDKMVASLTTCPQ